MRELSDLDALLRWCDDPHASPVAVESLDLTEQDAHLLRRHQYQDTLFLGCTLSQQAEHHIMACGGLIFPSIDKLPFNPYRGALYSPEELFDVFDEHDYIESFKRTFDQRVFEHFKQSGQGHPSSIRVSLAQSLHDHAMTDAKQEFVDAQRAQGKRIMAIMGGHKILRGSQEYLRVAKIARELTLNGFLVTTGGGPGAMEAGHFGAYMASRSEQELQEALAMLAARSPEHIIDPLAEYKDRDWMLRAWRVWDKYRPTQEALERYPSLGIPTWLYGHEPPTIFATHHAKYFANSIREEGLLSVAIDGVLYTPGRAGTVQEIFQDACQNYYGSMKYFSPMVFMNTAYWQETLPARALLDTLMAGKPQAALIAYEDDDARIIDHFLRYDREQWKA